MNPNYRPLWIGAIALVVAPFLLQALGLTLTSSTDVVIFAIAAMGLNLLVGYTGLTSFGHGAWFGIGAYAAALFQKHWLPGQFVLPLLLAVLFIACGSTAIGLLILRRRGVYFSLLTLALSALTFAIAFRWTALTGGESGLGGVVRPAIGPVNLDDPLAYLVLVSLIGWGVLYLLLRVVRSPFGHTVVAIRENEQRATFQGYDTSRYKLTMFVLSATVTGLAGALMVFHHRFASAEPTSVAFSGELLAMVVMGGMRSFLGPALGALFYMLFREFLSIWTGNWLLWFGLAFVGFILFSPTGLVGVWSRLTRRWQPPLEVGAAMGQRQIFEGLPLPGFLRPKAQEGLVLEVRDVAKRFGGIHAVESASLTLHAGQIHALIGPNGAGKTTTFNLISGMFAPSNGSVRLHGHEIQGLAPQQICQQGLARSFQITNLFRGLSIYENLRLSLQARHPARFNMWRDIDRYPEIHAETGELMKFLGLQGIEQIEGGALSYGGQRLVDLGIALGSKPQVLLMDEPLAGLAAAERERVSHLVKTIASNIPVLIVEHDIDRVLGLSQQVTVMNQGSVLMTGTPAEARADQRVQEIYTGTGTPPVTGRVAGDAQDRPQLLRFEAVNAFYGKSHILDDATLEVREGEIVALLGRNGAGKSTLLKTLTGLLKPASGRIEYAGRDIAGLSAPDIARMGIGYVPQGRGLFSGMTVAENLSLGRLARKTDGSTGTVWSEEKILQYFPRLKERLHTHADFLSGGEQQMVAVARALSGNVRLLLLDEPFEGLAPAVVQELFTVFDRLRKEVAIVIVEHNLDLVLALADRVFALERGAVFHTGPAAPLLTDLTYRKQILWL
ncbi:branched-chain amino acid ABC transporter ATP-binding protein/permease [Verminephrobacter eiseniae]|uniref:ABC transporter related n=1 Tax=Verminephrobacter eiseniae (strain EF01-2) TaxID=391735 RepID=A1WRZ1_VEREI|nr:branched-chain amino acid ABC transporter ATP-binding protein/permease [Verminephrobacter eiseniae]ABM60398.1 ABC transporter related [Verminephrobacter eiseniae EF01-2]MCW5285874.1 ATP-binding cassette domain-containing protein [Verminephrobacter eiseniae]MCW5304172.1 ATP-binding cassette domain-containing protein [Verminephrobacter eiseniae]MCW8181230.1 ATP-binding cassette domain-containing protein [Verminephrobacter eiseniae]MCW8192098.1 ATP-binding cassette domain-containing protein [V